MKEIFNFRFFFHHSFIIFFLSVPSQVEKLRKLQGWGVFQAPPGMDIPGVVGGSKVKMPSIGGMDIIWNHTICLQNPSILTDKHTDKVRRIIFRVKGRQANGKSD